MIARFLLWFCVPFVALFAFAYVYAFPWHVLAVVVIIIAVGIAAIANAARAPVITPAINPTAPPTTDSPVHTQASAPVLHITTEPGKPTRRRIHRS